MTSPDEIKKWTDSIEEILSDESIAKNETAIRTAFGLLQEVALKEKNPSLVDRALEIAIILKQEISLSADSLLCLFLRDPVRSAVISLPDCEKKYGKQITVLITGLNKISQLDTKKYSSNTENFIKLLLTISEDTRVILIRIADRLYEIRHLEERPADLRSSLTGETSLLYIPLTHRIGLYNIKTEMEDAVMKAECSDIYEGISRKIIETRKDRDQYISDFIRPIREKLSESGYDCEIKGRVKSIPSIWRKMRVQKVDFENVYDLFAIRIIIQNSVENEKADCWKVYSLVSDIYTPNPNRLRDWISIPKTTGYESLHSTVIGPGGKWVEVQIRTRRMDDIAEKGYAAHWKYKSAKKQDEQTEWFAYIRELLEKQSALSTEKAISREKRALYSDEIFIFTPKGDLKKLKLGYTILDFAFEIHTGIGATCTGAIVNGVMVPLKYELKNGDTVKILTSKNQKPNHNWLEIAKSPRNLAKIRHVLKMENYKESEWGREIVRNKVIQAGMEFGDPAINKLIDYFGVESFLELYQKVGEGKIDPMKIKKALAEPPKESQAAVAGQEEPAYGEALSEVLTGKQDYLVIDKNMSRVHYQFAKCCNPILGDKIFAFVSISQGVKIHKTNCTNARELITRYPYRILESRWSAVNETGSFTANLHISGQFNDKIIEMLTHFINQDLKIKIRSSKLNNNPDKTFTWNIGILVGSANHLDDTINRLRKVKGVLSVRKEK